MKRVKERQERWERETMRVKDTIENKPSFPIAGFSFKMRPLSRPRPLQYSSQFRKASHLFYILASRGEREGRERGGGGGGGGGGERERDKLTIVDIQLNYVEFAKITLFF
jgi:hypothetical protein